MVRKSIIIFLVLLTAGSQICNVAAIFGFLGAALNFVRFGDDFADLLSGELPLSALILGVEEYKIDRIFDTLQDVQEQLTEMSESLHNRLDEVLEELLARLPLKGRLDARMHDLHAYILHIDRLYRVFEFYVNKRTNFNNYTIEKYAETIVSYQRGDLPDILDRLHSLIVPTRSMTISDSLMAIIADDINVIKIYFYR